MDAVSKYLQQHAEPEVALLASFPDINIGAGIVIPAYNEGCEFLAHYITSPVSSNNLLVLVINQPDSDEDEAPQHQLNQFVIANSNLVWQQQNLSLHSLAQGYCLVVKRYQYGLRIPHKQGVGLARKIGADLLVALYQRGRIKLPWIYSSDADAKLPENYLINTPKHSISSALVFDFKHIKSSNHEVTNATQLYEQAMGYYVAGLKWAGSSYAYHSLGSALAFEVHYYAKVRGFPKRAAGEDFYLLNKLAKQASISTVSDICIQIKSRLSDRVPFGTGPKVQSLLQLDDIQNQYKYYSPAVFTTLKQLLTTFSSLNLNDLEHWQQLFNDEINKALISLGFDKALTNIAKNAKKEQQLQRQINEWFDAFRTLKFIHYIRDNIHPDIPLVKAIEQAGFYLPEEVEK